MRSVVVSMQVSSKHLTISIALLARCAGRNDNQRPQRVFVPRAGGLDIDRQGPPRTPIDDNCVLARLIVQHERRPVAMPSRTVSSAVTPAS